MGCRLLNDLGVDGTFNTTNQPTNQSERQAYLRHGCVTFHLFFKRKKTQCGCKRSLSLYTDIRTDKDACENEHTNSNFHENERFIEYNEHIQ